MLNISQFLDKAQSEQSRDTNDLKSFLQALDYTQQLENIVLQGEEFPEVCHNCKFKHSIFKQHNFVIREYSEIQFWSDLIKEELPLYQLCEWARKCIPTNQESDRMSKEDRAWNLIVQNKVQEGIDLAEEEEKQIISSLRPFGGKGEFELDFMQIEQGNMNWFETFQSLFGCSNVSKILQWAGCMEPRIEYWNYNHYEVLWLFLRAWLMNRLLHRHQQLYPAMKQSIYFGINEQQKWNNLGKYQIDLSIYQKDLMSLGYKLQFNIIKYILKEYNNLQEYSECINGDLREIINRINGYQNNYYGGYCLYQIGVLLIKFKFNNHLGIIIEELIEQDYNQDYIVYLISYLLDKQQCQLYCQQLMRRSQNQFDTLRLMKQHNIDQTILQEEIIRLNQNNSQSIEEFIDYIDRQSLEIILPQILANPDINQSAILKLMELYPESFGPLLDIFRIYYSEDLIQLINQLSNLNQMWMIQMYLLKILKYQLTSEQLYLNQYQYSQITIDAILLVNNQNAQGSRNIGLICPSIRCLDIICEIFNQLMLELPTYSKEDDDTLNTTTSTNHFRRHFGNNWTLFFYQGEPLITIGPHCMLKICLYKGPLTLCMILTFLGSSYLLVSIVAIHKHIYFYYMSIGIVVIQNISYLITALKNPGIVTAHQEYRGILQCIVFVNINLDLQQCKIIGTIISL